MNFQNLSPAFKGVVLFLSAWTIIPFMDAAAKKLGLMGYSIVEITWARFFFNAIIVLPFLGITQPQVFRMPTKFNWHLIRVVCLLAATFCYFSALKTMPIADALAIYFIYPFIITMFASVVLGEQVGIKRYTAVLVGFFGILIIVRPGFQELPVGVNYLIVASFSFAFYNLYTRKLAAESQAGQILGVQSLLGTIAMSVVVVFFWRTPDLQAILLFFTMGITSALAHFMLIISYQYANASFLAPFAYFEIISATIIGYLFFGDFPDLWTWVGIAVIVSCGIFISYRERN